MTENERMALDMAARYLRSHHCPECGRSWLTARSVGVLMHKCRVPVRRITRYRGVEERTAEERRAWAERQLGYSPIAQAIEDQLGDAAYLEGDET